ncbi:MAG: POTRA domain-containing protein [Candidatus Competibacteraceae bacterium]
MLSALSCTVTFAQSDLPQIGRPGEPRPPLPPYEIPGPAPLPLPPVAPPPEEKLAPQLEVYVSQFKLTGNTVFSDEELATVTKPYTNRKITSEELQEVRYKLTRYYVDRGYINSGAVIPEQQVTDGIIPPGDH